MPVRILCLRSGSGNAVLEGGGTVGEGEMFRAKNVLMMFENVGDVVSIDLSSTSGTGEERLFGRWHGFRCGRVASGKAEVITHGHETYSGWLHP